jgi:hypothetical protein
METIQVHDQIHNIRFSLEDFLNKYNLLVADILYLSNRDKNPHYFQALLEDNNVSNLCFQSLLQWGSTSQGYTFWKDLSENWKGYIGNSRFVPVYDPTKNRRNSKMKLKEIFQSKKDFKPFMKSEPVFNPNRL